MNIKYASIIATAFGMALSGYVSVAAAQQVTRELKVGETRHITAYRGNSCNAPAPSFAQIAGKLPRSKIVKYSDGGTSSRVSDQCGKRVPTRAVNGTGIKKGTETHRYQNTVRIVVK